MSMANKYIQRKHLQLDPRFVSLNGTLNRFGQADVIDRPQSDTQ